MCFFFYNWCLLGAIKYSSHAHKPGSWYSLEIPCSKLPTRTPVLFVWDSSHGIAGWGHREKLQQERGGLDVKFNAYRGGGHYFFIPFCKLEK